MKEVRKNRHQDGWIAALEAKFEGKGKVFGREDWDELLGCYSVSLFKSYSAEASQYAGDSF